MARVRKDKNGVVLRQDEGQRADGRYYYQFTTPIGKRRVIYAKSLEELRKKELITWACNALKADMNWLLDLTLNEAFDLYIACHVLLGITVWTVCRSAIACFVEGKD